MGGVVGVVGGGAAVQHLEDELRLVGGDGLLAVLGHADLPVTNPVPFRGEGTASSSSVCLNPI